MAKKTKQEAQQERLSLAEKRNRQERRNKKARKEREQEKRRKKQERDRRKQKNIPTTAQQSIFRIFGCLQDGICQVTKTFFSKTIQFYDIKLSACLNEDKIHDIENYCDFLNYFDSSISVQLSFINQQVDVAEFEKSIDIPDQNDDFNAIREEYRTMLKNQAFQRK